MYSGFILLLCNCHKISNEILGSLVFLLVLLIPTLYFSNWDYSLIFQKPTKNELILAVLMFLAYVIYSAIFTNLLTAGGLAAIGNSNENIISLLCLIFKMMAEELIKFIPLMFLLRVFYKYTSDRRLSVIVASIITLIFFGMIHAIDGSSIIAAVVIQGFGSVFHLYAYLKTKNLFISYLSHLMTDAILIIMTLMGIFA